MTTDMSSRTRLDRRERKREVAELRQEFLLQGLAARRHISFAHSHGVKVGSYLHVQPFF